MRMSGHSYLQDDLTRGDQLSKPHCVYSEKMLEHTHRGPNISRLFCCAMPLLAPLLHLTNLLFRFQIKVKADRWQ